MVLSTFPGQVHSVREAHEELHHFLGHYLVLSYWGIGLLPQAGHLGERAIYYIGSGERSSDVPGISMSTSPNFLRHASANWVTSPSSTRVEQDAADHLGNASIPERHLDP